MEEHTAGPGYRGCSSGRWGNDDCHFKHFDGQFPEAQQLNVTNISSMLNLVSVPQHRGKHSEAAMLHSTAQHPPHLLLLNNTINAVELLQHKALHIVHASTDCP